MSIDKLNIRFNEPIYDQENIDKLKNKVNEVIDGVEDVEEASIPKTQKLYCHPVSMSFVDTNSVKYGNATCLILDNNGSAYTPTTFVAKLKDIASKTADGARIMISGCYKSGDDIFPNLQLFVTKVGNALTINYGLSATNYSDTGFLADINNSDFRDAVNEIYPNISEE